MNGIIVFPTPSDPGPNQDFTIDCSKKKNCCIIVIANSIDLK